MDRVPFAISQSNVDKGKSIENSKRELSWSFGWTDSRTEHEVVFKYDDVSGKKAITMDGKDIYNEIDTKKGLSHCWESRKGHFFQIEHLDDEVVFSIDERPFEEFMFPRPVRTAADLEELDASSDEEGNLEDDNESVLSKFSTHPMFENEDNEKMKYEFDIEVINPTVHKSENYVTYTVNTACDDPALPQLARASVNRRYNDFAYLHNQLSDCKEYQGMIIPPLPAKQTLGRFEPAFLEDRRAALFLFLLRIRDHAVLRRSHHFISFLYQSESQLLMEKNCFYHDRESDIRTSVTDWFGSAFHTLATSVGKYEAVGLGFNPLDVQVDEIESYIEPLVASMQKMEVAAKNFVLERRNCQAVCSEWGRAVAELGDMPPGPSTLEQVNGISLSQILELEPEPEIEPGEEYEHLKDTDDETFQRIDSHKFPSDISDLTADDMTLNSVDGTRGSRSWVLGMIGGGIGQSAPSERKLNRPYRYPPDVESTETLTTVAEKECGSFLHQLGCTSENTSDLLKDLASAHEIEVCRIINEYGRLLSAIKKAIGIRKDAKKRFTESIAVKLEKYRQYNCAMEAFASTDKIAKKLDAYNDAKRDMLENRQVHLQISKNLIHDFHRFMRAKEIDLKKIAVDVLTFNLLNCQDNIDNWTNTMAILSLEIDGADL